MRLIPSLPALLLGSLATSSFAQPAPPAQPVAPSLAEACPTLSAAEIRAIETYRGEFAENALYARAYCVSVVEAERRMAIQNREAVGPRTEPGPPPPPPADSIGAINGALQSREAGTFAGLWIEHRPDYRVVVAFTRDAAATLAKYTKDPLFKPLDRPGPTLAELRAMQDRLTEEFSRRGYRWSSAGGREDKGIVEIALAQEAAPIRAAAARGEFPLPDWVKLVEPRPLPFPAPPAPRADDRRVASFPQLAHRTDMYPRTLVGVQDQPARLRLVDGCLVLESGNDRRTALWQASDALDLSDPERVGVIDRLSGVRVFAGEEIVLMGLQPGEEQVPKEVVGSEACPGPYRVVRGFVPRAAWDRQQREGGIARRTHELGDRIAAAADYEADRARLSALHAWRARILAEQGEAVAAVWIDEDNGTAHLFHTAARPREILVPAGLLPFVTAQEVPLGRRPLESARLSLETQLAAAGLAAQIEIEPIGGVVRVTPADPRGLAAAARAGRIAFPEVAVVAFEGAGPVFHDEERLARDAEAVWRRLETAPDFAAIRSLVEATALPVIEPAPPPRRGSEGRPSPPPSPPRRARPSKASSLQSAQFLVAYGQSAREIAALKARGFDPVDALDAMNGRATPLTSALLARQVVVAEFLGLDPRDPARDGYRSTARWRVIETLKGAARSGEVLRTRMVSGDESDGRLAQSNEEPPILPGLPRALEPGGRWLLHLNDALYAHSAFVHGGPGAARTDGPFHVATIAPAPLVGDTIEGPLFGRGALPLAALRQTLAPLQAAMVASGLIAPPPR